MRSQPAGVPLDVIMILNFRGEQLMQPQQLGGVVGG
jgi:hypothetical protein